MLIIKNIKQLREWREQQSNKIIGFVPTMGYLHEGHVALMQHARKAADIVIVSIFVNPLQFGANEDLDKYPRNPEGDQELCTKADVDVLFMPEASDVYANGYPPKCTINVANLGNNLCGAKRLGHFDGVCTVVAKLFNLVGPHKAFFGRKDIQQLRIIQTMTSELNFPIEIIGVDTVRAEDGLALSSRNSYLSPTQRKEALVVPQLLQYVTASIKNGQTNVAKLLEQGDVFMQQYPYARVDYLQIVNYSDLQATETINNIVIIATAIFIGNTRLIDNIIYTPGTGNPF